MNPLSSPLLTDHYQLTMLQSYIEWGMEETAVFELFVRKLPRGRNFMVVAGLEQALGFLENLKFSAQELNWLSTRFPPHFASGNLDEYRLQALLSSNAPIDGFGIGTALDISTDSPALDCAYKLQEYAGKARRKHSEGKITWPGRKQVYRNYGDDGCMTGDIVALEENDPQEGERLIQPVMRAGCRLYPNPSLHDIRRQTIANYRRLPASMTTLELAPMYPVTIFTALQALAMQLDRERKLC